MAFLSRGIEEVRSGGSIVALMPANSITSEKDERSWNAIRSIARVTVVESLSRGVFADATASVNLITVESIDKSRLHTAFDAELFGQLNYVEGTPSKRGIPIVTSIVRGSLAMYKNRTSVEGSSSVPLIHTTDLQENSILESRWTSSKLSQIRGPAVLIPRVGKPMRSKIVYLPSGRVVALSDCVFGIKCRNREGALTVAKSMHESWEIIENQYVGSCAKYLTVYRLRALLRSLGVEVTD